MNQTVVMSEVISSKVRRNPVSSVNNGRYGGGQLDWSDLERECERDAAVRCEEGYCIAADFGNHALYPGAGGLTGKIHPRFCQQAELPEIIIVTVYPNPHPNRNKHWVAGVHRPLHKILSPMSAHLMTANPLPSL